MSMKKSIKASEVGDEHVLIDVRTPGEFASEKAPGAVNIPLTDLEHQCESLQWQKNLVLVCASGQRARKAQEILESRGIHACVLEDGMRGWSSGQRAVEKTGGGRISLERQVRILAGSLAATAGLLAVFVDPRFGVLAAFVGLGLVFAGVTDSCAMAMILAKLPYNSGKPRS